MERSVMRPMHRGPQTVSHQGLGWLNPAMLVGPEGPEETEMATQKTAEDTAKPTSRADRMESVELESWGASNGYHIQTVRFTGACLARDESQTTAIYMTKGGRFVLHFDSALDGSTHKVYDSLEELREDREDLDDGLLADAFEAVGRPFVIHID